MGEAMIQTFRVRCSDPEKINLNWGQHVCKLSLSCDLYRSTQDWKCTLLRPKHEEYLSSNSRGQHTFMAVCSKEKTTALESE